MKVTKAIIDSPQCRPGQTDLHLSITNATLLDSTTWLQTGEYRC